MEGVGKGRGRVGQVCKGRVGKGDRDGSEEGVWRGTGARPQYAKARIFTEAVERLEQSEPPILNPSYPRGLDPCKHPPRVLPCPRPRYIRAFLPNIFANFSQFGLRILKVMIEVKVVIGNNLQIHFCKDFRKQIAFAAGRSFFNMVQVFSQ